MKLDKYALKAGQDQIVFEFISEGTNRPWFVVLLAEEKPFIMTRNGIYKTNFCNPSPFKPFI